ncbi:hypothetical protein RJ53_05285 [Methanocalculus chunghsingensis]|uniref:Tryptophan transporter n=1 Tax=Methanocalculus chunghsingensis TaxID=156457 RepID=A0A8J7W7H9_9EURY|nr:hypothetical protein [Methanocalculus chunghsingensis]MBR1368948.1 hypothetical protein [Methanocalculus chunghsingensis]
MKSRDIAIVGILLAAGAIVRFMSLVIPGPIVANLVIAFYSLAILLVVPKVNEALGIGVIAGLISALISHSIFPPANLISEPVGAVVCILVFMIVKDRIKIGAPGISATVATLASGFTFVGVVVLLLLAAPGMLAKAVTLTGFVMAIVPIVVLTAFVNGIIVQMLYPSASRILER